MKVTLKVFRFNAETDYLPHYDTIEMKIDQKDVVLDVLNRIKWEHDGSFTYRRSCRHGICGSCAVKVNGRSTLACKERMVDMIELFGNELVIEPVSKKRVIKDMVVDKTDFWKKYETVKPWLEAEIDEHPTMENIIPPKEAEKLEEADYCIQCGCCYYACPVVEVNEEYLGPAAFEKAYRFTADVRDNAKKERLEIVDILGQGVWDCVKCFECAEACPKEIDPIGKITKLHNQIFEEGVAKSNVATRHAVGFKKSIEKHGILDEGHLVAYSEGFGVLKHIPEALEMFKKGKIVMPWNMPKSKNLDEIKKLIKTSSTVKF
ncbi:succinate dehydrogenase / fumarate reductase, iron-sulfur subunit [Nitratiruptor sp. YY08-26]|uniref:succinate dehydrogenase/fumarate reductase iron-sulfur subunit n=1 Tax=unclassified Nitratiruptor TaxID=2624044 RepID=UPI001915B626|nr:MULTISPECIES: succinate dehydrogenase/fumarate reductase iron-sulfur subunit [unclassified Nitratiruptor]BCD62491.1 succinate dehydrogenase / fumarate reductase, iron-sulfur subunit [Nitratiruptor sp. YY08-13]BCD66427.1 succinate dehydrogenase / fumarate reductase, iron-sulfur subunit [Nitratiruptor sp. YY08-26]